ncbi:helix-turn-helix domain-containing protein [Streptomyces sp. NPDC006134]|uniref:helix-turn-helix domain-containing protein n=1 Tax=Streptomyces sp. NPDC006134 TaxID=3154467 RepID=UPI0033F6AFA6
MTDQQPSAPARTASGRSTGGVEHVNVPHTENFTVVGNHLLQHPELSLTAIGLAVHIQSLPAGTTVGIKALAAKFPEGEIRIAAALRELEAHGYLARTKERLRSGRVVTRTVSYNHPRAAVSANHPRAVVSANHPRAVVSANHPRAAVSAAAPEPQAEKPPAVAPAPPADRTAADLLVRLRTHDSRLLLTERDVRRLAPAVSAWLERGVPATAVLRTLTTGLPQDPIRHPAALLRHRLTTDLPPHLPAAPAPASEPRRRPDPLQTCDGCDRAFRAPRPGRCRDCRTAPPGRRAA